MSKNMKRTATTELTRDNWDQDDEPEEAGTFKSVSQEELSRRVIKVARRRLPKTNDEQRPLFSGFSGFGKTNTGAPDVKNAFSFLSNVNGSSTQTSPSVPVSNENKSENEKSSTESIYLANIKTLNECLIDWLNKCVQKNPSCVFTPIFRDYENHLQSLKPTSEKSVESKSSEVVSSFTFNTATNTNNQNSKDGVKSPLQNENKFSSAFTPLATTTSSSWMSTSTLTKTNLFGNLSANNSEKPSQMFSFLSKPSALQNAPAAEKNESSKKDDEDDETPPVNDFKPVTEDDALFSQRVKVFVKNDKQYADHGVGTLYIKEAKDAKGDKIHQVIVRADTSLGNIILNFRITKDIPTKRVGKNNVMVACCLPTTQSKPTKSESKPSTPVPVLLRVKTEEDADKLMNEINKYK